MQPTFKFMFCSFQEKHEYEVLFVLVSFAKQVLIRHKNIGGLVQRVIEISSACSLTSPALHQVCLTCLRY